ncbi:2-iminoacetate synthase ThiH [Vibrio sp. RC27]
MSFSEYIKKLDWDDIRLCIYSKTESDVTRALGKKSLTLDDFCALLSPAAEPYLEQIAQKAQSLTRNRFGNTVNMYVPLYLSNLCSNVCTYCGFSMENRIKRKTLDLNEIGNELVALKNMGFDSLLLVTGEHESKVGLEYFKDVVPLAKRQFNYLAMEVQPLEQEEYQQLIGVGLDAVMVYQETYNRITYAEHHKRGNKSNFDFRLDTPDRLGRAGIDKIGLGALIGLDDWRVDLMYLAHHLSYLEKVYWKSRYSISFPRLRPCTGGVATKSVMSDRQLVQAICAFRMLSNEVELSLSTRESPDMRDNTIPIAITSISAASKTQPGGYSNGDQELEQFSTGDDRSADDVASALIAKGLQPVWKDWEPVFSG